MPAQDTALKNPEKLFPVAGIGASAGGLEASQKLVGGISADSGIAYILLQHLHPDHETVLPDLLGKESRVLVTELAQGTRIEPDHVYVIPSDKFLTVVDGVLKLLPRDGNSEGGKSIDLFFASLAEVYQANTIGIVLSGTGSDGSEGLKDIKAHGGITFAQEPGTAAYPSMPENAIEGGAVDFVLPPEKIPPRLEEMKQSYLMFSGPSSPVDEEAEQKAFRQILSLLRVRKDVDFTLYKQTTIRRRIIRRMLILKMKKIGDYHDFLKKDKHEQDLLFQDLLIPVTAFFRDQRIFNTLFDSILPSLLKGKSYNPLRIWVAGCSTGQEAYSIAIGLLEHLGDRISTLNVKIFGSDILESSVSKARSGCYEKKELKGIPENLILRFFEKKDGIWQVRKIVRDMCVFATHNFLNDPPFAKMDLISCRNVLIYMEPFLQTKALSTFHYALKEKGVLWLGKSESTGEASDLFMALDKKDKFYVRKSVEVRYSSSAGEKGEHGLTERDGLSRHGERGKDDVQKNADAILLARFTPAAVVVNGHFDIVQFRGSTGDYLEPSPGKASLNILKMAREGLSFEIRNGLHKAKISGEPFRKEDIPLQKGKKLVDIDIIPMHKTIELHFLVVFTAVRAQLLEKEEDAVDTAAPPETARSREYMRIRQLEDELELTRENMRIITEAQESAYALLQTANEELLSSDEELQSLNEELETSKEELQSTNEELHILNSDLSERNEQLNLSRQFAEAIIECLHEPILVLENDFTIRRANRAFYHLFRLSPEQAVGKVLFKLQEDHWDIPALHDGLRQLKEGKSAHVEMEFKHVFLSCGERIMRVNLQLMEGTGKAPYILMTMEDMTDRRREEDRMNKLRASSVARQILHHFFRQTPAMLCILIGSGYVIDFVNDFFMRILDRPNPIGKKLLELFPDDDTTKLKEVLDRVYITGEPFIARSVPVKNKGLFIDILFQSYKNDEGQTEGILLFCYDVTSEVNALSRVTEAELKYRELIQGLPVAVYLSDVDGHITLYNRAAEELWGRRPEIGKDRWSGSWKAFRPDGSPLAMQDSPMAIALQEGRIVNEEIIIEKPDGGRRHVIPYPKPVYDSNGSITGAVNTLIDITDRAVAAEKIAASELRFRDMANNIPSYVWVSDDKGNRNFFNKSWQDFTGRDPSQDEGMGWTDLVHSQDLKMVMKIYMKGMQDHKPFKIVYRLRRHDGKYRWTLMRTNPVFDVDGKFSGFLGTCNEIHEQKIKEQKKDEFINIASHEMKTPLSSTKAYLQLFTESMESTNEEAGLYIKKASKAVERLENLITELLDASKIQNGRLNYNFSTFNFNEMMAAAVEGVQYTSPDHKILLEGKVEQEVYGDRERLQQVVVNLLTNAVKYSPRADKVFVRVEEHDGKITVAVRDKGIGISKDNIKRIFERYYRVKDNDSVQFQGLGIGLFISHDIIQCHHGKLWVESEPGEGSTFYFTIPAASPKDNQTRRT